MFLYTEYEGFRSYGLRECSKCEGLDRPLSRVCVRSVSTEVVEEGNRQLDGISGLDLFIIGVIPEEEHRVRHYYYSRIVKVKDLYWTVEREVEVEVKTTGSIK